MNRSAYFVAIGLVSASLLAIASCTGDDPDLTTVADDGSTSAFDSPSSNTEGGPLGDGGGDAADANTCLVTPTGKYAASKAYPFTGTIEGVRSTSDDGRIYAGYFRGSATFDPAMAAMVGNTTTEDATAARINPDGTAKWQVHFGGTGTDSFQGVAIDDKDDVYVSGDFDSASFTIGSTTITNTVGNELGIIAKLDGQTGNPIWVKQFQPGTFGFGCRAIDFDSGRLVVSCSMGLTQAYDTAGGSQTLQGSQVSGASVYGLDPATGNALWGHGFGTGAGADAAVSTNIDSVDVTAGGVVVAGTFQGGTLGERQTNAISVAQIGTKQNGFVTELAIAAPAAPLWAKGFGDTTNTGGVYGVVASGTSATGVAVGASFQGTVDFGAGAHASVGASDAIAMMLNNKAGAPSWEKLFAGSGEEDIGSITFDRCGHPELMFLTYSAIPAQDGVTIPAAQAGGVAVLLTKMAGGDGKLLWASGVAPGGDLDRNGINEYDLWVDGKGDSVIVGDFRGSIDFGNGTPAMASGGSQPYFVEYKP